MSHSLYLIPISSLLKKLVRVPIAASRACSRLACLCELWLRHNTRFAHVSLHQRKAFWLRHNIRFAHVSLHRNSRSSFSRGSLRGSLRSGRSLRFFQQTARFVFFAAWALTIGACATTTSTISPEDCPAGTQKFEGCPPIGAIHDAEIAEIYAQRAYERDDLPGFDSVRFARDVDIPVNDALIKFVGSTDEGALTAIAAKIWMIENAEHTIDVIYYIFRDDLVGSALLGALCDAVQRGVDVRMMIDSLGAADLSRKNLKALQSCAIDAGFMVNSAGQTTIHKARVQAVIFNSFTENMLKANRRSHDKLIVKDGRFQHKSYAITGGRNVSLDYYAFLEDGSPNPHSYRDAEILVRGTADDKKGEWGIGDVSTGYYTLLFLFENNKKLKMTTRSDPLSAYADYRDRFRESLAALKALPRVRERLDAMPDYMSGGFHEASVRLGHELANVTNKHVVTKAVENLAESPNSIVKILDRIRQKDFEHISIVSPYLFAPYYKDDDGNVVVDGAQRVRDWLDQHPNSTIDIVTNSVLTSGNSSTQAVIDVDLVPRLLMTEDMKEKWGSKQEESELIAELVQSDSWIEMVNHPRLRIYETGKLDDVLFGGHYHHSKLHAKYIVGDHVGFVGTSNLDYRSRLYNSEMGFFFDSVEMANDIAENTDYLISLSYRWGSPEWLEMRQRLQDLGGMKGFAVRHQRGIYKTIKNTGLMWLF
jgi:putative cardiolipin synthase